jgi:hypothetical protein
VVLLAVAVGACEGREQRPSGFGIDPTGSPTASVGPFALHLDPAAVRLAEGQKLVLLDVVQPVIERVAESLRSPPASITIVVAPERVIPEVGVGGATDAASGNIRVSLDGDARPDIRQALTTALPRSLAHEAVHSARILDGPGPGRTLRDTIIDEGLADQFAQWVLPRTQSPPWTRALTPQQTADLWRRAQPLLDESDRKLRLRWLFGGEDIPKWTAYTLGTEIMAAYRGNQPTEVRWDDLVRQSSQRILSDSGYTPPA